MNKNLYRIVFNRALGLLQVVAETARRDGPGASTGTSKGARAAGSRFLAMLSPLCFALALALGQAVIVVPAHAQIAADPNAPGNQRPTVMEAANGVPLVNIQTPSAAGVSRNTYRQFDVEQQGAILNNSRTNTQTQLGGWVQGNPWLGKGDARVILNEVNASDPSRLNGYIEVAGNRAQLVIANPAGITCDGCGFINADRVTLTTGKPVINGGSLEGYRVQGGAIRIQGKGMDANATDYTDLIARSVQANAGIWARQLQVTTGANEVSTDHAEVQKLAASGDAPAFALDVDALGGMYSQKIVLVGTEQGVGMRNAGAIGAQVGQLVVTAQGRLENSGTMQAATDTHIDASGGVTNAGTLSAGRELVIATSQDIDNSRGTLNARRIEIGAQSLANRGGAIEQTGTQALALRTSHLSNGNGGRIGLASPDAGKPPVHSGTAETGTNGEAASTDAGGDTGAIGGSPVDRHSGGGTVGSSSPVDQRSGGGSDQPVTGTSVAPLAAGRLNIAATLDNDGGRIIAGGDIDITASAGLDNDGGYLGASRLNLQGGDLSNQKGDIKVAADTSIAAGLLKNDTGLMQLAGTVALNAQDFSNQGGTFQHSGKSDTHIKVKGRLDNSEGTLASNAGRLALDADQLLNTGGTIAAGGNLALTSGSLNNRQGTIEHAGGGTLAVTSGDLDGARGKLVSKGAISLNAGKADLSGGTIQADKISITADRFSTVGASLVALGSDVLAITVTGAMDTRRGTIAGNGAIKLTAQSLKNQDGKMSATGPGPSTVQVTQQLDNANGRIAIAGDATVKARDLHNQGGSVVAAGQSALTVEVAGNLDNGAKGTLTAGGDLAVRPRSSPEQPQRHPAARWCRRGHHRG